MSLSLKTSLAELIYSLMRPYQRLVRDEARHQPCPGCLAPHVSRISSFIARNQPIVFILPGFPAKSPNPLKTISHLPDMAEGLALKFLQKLCQDIRKVYAPGARIVICSDGRVFSDLVRVPDAHVSEYQQALKRMSSQQLGNDLSILNLEDIYPGRCFDAMRTVFLSESTVTPEVIRAQVKTDHRVERTFNGICRFMLEDLKVLEPAAGRPTHLRKTSKLLAYQVMQRSTAWGDLISRIFPDAVRLSIHPQSCHSDKFGIHLLSTADNWLTPWHGAAVKTKNGFCLMKRHEAETRGARLIASSRMPNYYELEEGP